MFWNKTKKNTNGNTSTEIVRQDPRTKIRTTVGQTQSTNTTVKNATIFNDQARTVTYQTTTQTITHHQLAGVTEIQTRRTATPEELEAFMATLNMGTKMEQNNNTSVTHLISTYESPKTSTAGFKDNNNKTTKTKINAQTLLANYKTEETTVTQKSGRSVTSSIQEQRIKLKMTGATTTTKSKQSTDAPFLSIRALPSLTDKSSSYTSPYTNFTLKSTSKPITDAKPFVNVNNYNKFKSSPKLRESLTLIPQPNTRIYTTSRLRPSATTSSLPSIAGKSSAYSRLNSSSPVVEATQKASINKLKSKLKPGLMYIFNNEEFDDSKNEYRVGSSMDVKTLRETFEAFKLKVEVFKNPTMKDIRAIVKSIETKDFTNRSCLVIAILSHGHRFERVLAKNEAYAIDDDVLFPILRNRTLIDKPKIFFIQACKGSMEIGGLHKDSQQPHGAPAEVLKCYSTFEGYVSYRTENGSIFVQKLCENIKRDGYKKSIDEIMKEVTSSVKAISKQKQIPTMTTTLTKPLIFGNYV